jgi:ParB-like nuclease domain
LAASIQARGLMQPIVVRPVASGYELVADNLTPADRKLVRRAITALRRLA